jgi:periplasmic divalent cation tolerance protein
MIISIVYSMFGSEKDAANALDEMLSAKVVACGNYFPCTSSFVWNDSVHNEKEWVLIVKTSHKMSQNARDWLQKHHCYEVPAILSWPVQANESYARWVEEQVGSVTSDQ